MIIEASNCCSLNYKYYYETDKNSKQKISEDINRNILRYIENVFSTQNIKTAQIGCIGGEPLLQKEIVLDICKRIKYICQKYDRKVHFYINIDGTIPFKDLYKEIDNLQVSVSLTNKLDHNRPGIGFHPFQRIVNNLKRVQSNEKDTNAFEKSVKSVKFVKNKKNEINTI